METGGWPNLNSCWISSHLSWGRETETKFACHLPRGHCTGPAVSRPFSTWGRGKMSVRSVVPGSDIRVSSPCFPKSRNLISTRHCCCVRTRTRMHTKCKYLFWGIDGCVNNFLFVQSPRMAGLFLGYLKKTMTWHRLMTKTAYFRTSFHALLRLGFNALCRLEGRNNILVNYYQYSLISLSYDWHSL